MGGQRAGRGVSEGCEGAVRGERGQSVGRGGSEGGECRVCTGVNNVSRECRVWGEGAVMGESEECGERGQ